jgi:hypothetical protein
LGHKRGLKHVSKGRGSLNTTIDLEPETNEEVRRHEIVSEHVATVGSRRSLQNDEPPSVVALAFPYRTTARATEKHHPYAIGQRQPVGHRRKLEGMQPERVTSR